MAKLVCNVLSAKGKKVETVDLNPVVFGAPQQDSLVHDVVVWQRRKARAGTHSTLTRTKMIGGNKKPWKQKHTGRARAGSTVSPLWVGGAVVFGPAPRDYTTRVSKRAKRQALCAVLSDKVRSESLIVLEELAMKNGKTKEAAEIFAGIGAEKGGAVVLMPSDAAERARIERATRNIPGVLPVTVQGVNPYDLLRHRYFVCTKQGLEALEKRVVGAE